jgi:predicted transglutaminase-like cysteine proteinase
MLLVAPYGRSQSGSDEPFGAPSVIAQEGPWWLTWKRLQAQMLAEAPVITRCRLQPADCTLAAGRFAAVVEAGAGRDGLARIGHINRAANHAIRFKENTSWTSPLATLSAGIGDCKHYALIKYAALQFSGTKQEDVRIIIVNIRSLRASHMVLAVREAGQWLIVDNRNLALVDSRDLPDYEPLYAFDYRGMHRFAAAAALNVAQAACQVAG